MRVTVGAGRRPRHDRRGRPVWEALAALVLLPLVAACVAGGASLRAASRSADQTLRAQHLVTDVELLDAARRSVDAEVTPTMLAGALRDPAHAAAIGFNPGRRAVLLATMPAQLAAARAVTDRAFAAVVPHAADLTIRAGRLEADLRAARALADSPTSALGDVGRTYGVVTAVLGSAQEQAGAHAVSAGLSTRSVAALQDLDRVVQVSEAGSRQLPELFSSRVLPQPVAAAQQRAWLSSWGAYTALAGRSWTPSSREVGVAWKTYLGTPDVTTFSALLDRQALDPAQTVIETGALPGLVARSTRRDDAVAVVLQDAVAAVTAAAQADRAEAVARERAILEITLVILVVALADVALVVRWLSVSMRALAGAAERVSQGHLVDVPTRGPRELRTAARALSSAVAGLRRVQEQARAVVAGDVEAAVRQRPLPGPLGDVVHASVGQIAEAFRAREVLQEELSHQASHDALTGLPNRAQTLRDLAAALARGQRGGRGTGLLFIDLDGFKAVNDSHGHAAGDELLREVGRRLSATLRSGDLVGRLGGDEFVVIAAGVEDPRNLVTLGNRLIAAIRRPITVPAASGDHAPKEVHVGASIGVCMDTDGSTSPDALLAEADAAAYRAKRLGRGRVEVFDDAVRAELAERADTEGALRAGLDAGQLDLRYQPVVALSTGAITGFEALARWTRPGVGEVLPAVFVPVAEASTLVCELGRWALAEATTQAAQWRSQWRSQWQAQVRAQQDGDIAGALEPTITVNLSGRHLAEPTVTADVMAALAGSGLPPHLLVIDVSEGALSDVRVLTNLQALRDLGVGVAIDDFGTGSTSVAALARTPADILKIDRSVIASGDASSQALATLIATAARTIGLQVVVEGIETPGQLARARADGCDAGQGHLFSPALTAGAVAALARPFLPLTLEPTA